MKHEQILQSNGEAPMPVGATISGIAAASTNVRDLADALLDFLASWVAYRKATLQLVQGDERNLVAYRGFDETGIDPWLLRPISQDPLITRLFASQTPLILSNPQEDPDWVPRHQTANVHSWIGIPLVYAGQTIGLVTLDHDQPGYYRPALQDFLQVFANHAAPILENRRLVDFGKRREQDLQFLNEIAANINAKLDTRNLLSILVAQITQKLQCSHCAIFTPREDAGEVVLCPEVVEPLHAPQITSRRFKVGEGVAGWVYEHGESVLLPDARLDPRFAPGRKDEDLPRSLLVVPIQVGEQTTGVISADHTVCDWFTHQDLLLVEALARQAGIAIQRNRSFELLRDIGAQINSAREIEDILRLIVKGAIELIQTTSGVIYHVSEDGSAIKNSYIYPPGSLHPPPRMDNPHGSTRTIIATGKPLLYVDVDHPDVHEALREHIQSMLGVPLKHDQKVIGVLYLNDEKRHDFTTTEVDLLQTLGNQAATAIYKADLMQNLEVQVARHRVLNEVGATLVGLQDEQHILEAVSSAAKETLKASHCSVFQRQGDAIIVRAAQGSLEHDLQPGREFKVGQGIAGWVAQTGQLALVADTTLDERFDPSWSPHPPRAIVASPILVEGRVYGVISAEHNEVGYFTQLDQQLIETLALQASQAVRSAQRIHALQSLNNTVHRLSQDLNLKSLFETLLDNVNTTLGCLYSAVFLKEPSGELVETARRGGGSEHLPRRTFGKDEGLAGYVAATRQTLNLSDVSQNPYYIDSRIIPKEQPHSMLLVPMIRQDQLVGLISADKDVLNGFSDSDARLLETLASQAAISYENARLFGELEVLHDISRRFFTLDLDRLLEQIVRGAVELTQTEYGVIYLLSENGTQITASVGYPVEKAPAHLTLSRQGITRQIYQSREPQFVANAQEDPRVSAQVSQEWQYKSFIGYPIQTKQRVIGVLYLNDTSYRAFSTGELKLVDSLAWQAAAAIESARLFTQQDQSTKALRSSIAIVGTIGMDKDPLPVILQEIKRLLPDVEDAFFALVPSRRRKIEIHAMMVDGVIHSGEEIPRSRREHRFRRSRLRELITTGVSFRSGNIRGDPDYKPWRDDAVSALLVPMRDSAGVLVGALGLESRKRDLFGLSQQDLCQDLANIAAIAYEKGQLYADLQRQVKYMQALRDVTNQVTALPERQDILEVVVRVAQETLETSRCTLFELNEDGVLVPRAVIGIEREQVSSIRFPMGEGLAGWVAQEAQSLLVPDAREDERYLEDELVANDVARRMLLAPLWLEGKVIGVMSADRDGGDEFDEVDRHFFEILAVQAGIFIRQLHLRRRRVEAVRKRFNPYTVGPPISNPDGFYGRHKILSEIIDGIHNNHYIIFGERRIGKTSLLMQLEYQLNTLSGQDAIYQYVPIFVSLQALPSEQQLFAYLIERILWTTLISPGYLYHDPSQAGYSHKEMEDDLEIILEDLQDRYPGKRIRIVLLLDEMDIFSQYSYETHCYLRSLLMSRPGTQLQLVMAGVSIHYDANLPTSPWYNLFISHELKPFQASTARQMVREQVIEYYTYEEEALEHLLICSDYKPMELQRLASLSVTNMLDRIQPELAHIDEDNPHIEPCITRIDVTEAVQQALEQRGREYQNLWETLTSGQKRLLRQALEAGGELSPEARETLGVLLSEQKALFSPILISLDDHIQLTHLFMCWLQGGNHEESL